jgi:hypothetical protein
MPLLTGVLLLQLMAGVIAARREEYLFYGLCAAGAVLTFLAITLLEQFKHGSRFVSGVDEWLGR